MSAKFITAIYSNLMGTRFNGVAPAIYNRYKLSLESLAKGGYEIICYTSKEHYDELVEFYKTYPNLEVVSEELTEFYYHNDIERIKDIDSKYTNDASWKTRCVEIMWGKFYWLYRHAALSDNNDHIFWIDAGLFHSGLIHSKWKNDSTDKSEFSFDFNRITQERNLYIDLCNHTKDKILNIRCSYPNHGSDDYMKVFQESHPQYSIIGGIFGAKRDNLLEYIPEIIESMQATIDANILLKEEELMYHVYNKQPSRFETFEFSTWYHEDWSDAYRRGETISFSDYFEFIRS